MQKHLLFLLLCLISATAVSAQDDTHDISGTWYGIFSNYMGEKQRLLIVLEKSKRGYAGQLKSPDKTDVALTMDSVEYTSGVLRFRVNEIGLSYKGGWDAANKRFNGYMYQSGDQFPLNISKDEISRSALYVRPQDPRPPFNYRREDVIFSSPDDQDIAIAGTFTRPADSTQRYPVVILISDGGPQDRNEEMLGHRPFAVIADMLAKSGIAVLRCDDRGVGGSSGNYDDATLEDQASDVRAAINYLRQRKDVDASQIGLLGHGKGAAVAEIAAADNDSVAFLISLAGPGLPLRQQQEGYLVQTLAAIQPGMADSTVQRFLKAAQPWFNLLATEKNEDKIQEQGRPYLQQLYREFGAMARMPEKVFVEGMMAVQTTPNMLSTFRFDPPAYLARIKCPVLALNGTKDLSVDAELNLAAIQNALVNGGNQQVTIRSFEGLNHLFQQCKTCVASEYSSLDQTIDPAVLEFLARWVVVLVNRN